MMGVSWTAGGVQGPPSAAAHPFRARRKAPLNLEWIPCHCERTGGMWARTLPRSL